MTNKNGLNAFILEREMELEEAELNLRNLKRMYNDLTNNKHLDMETKLQTLQGLISSICEEGELVNYLRETLEKARNETKN